METADSRVKYMDLWKALQMKPPVKAFCTARALQLLNSSGLNETVPKEIYSLIFNLKFPLIINKSLPTPGEKIVDALPFKVLQHLYNFPEELKKGDKEGDKGINLPANYDQLKKLSIGKLLLSFGVEGENKTIQDIIEMEGKKISSNGVEKDPLKIRQLRSQAILLFKEQFRHTAAVNKLINKIFIIKNSITLNPVILAEGVLGIEKIAIEARDMLVDYYSKCQTEYNIGVKILTRESTQLPPSTSI